jgi:predicted enzyme related to lactoylglutathione lyase
MDPSQHIVNYIGVPSIDAAIEKVKNLGGRLIMDKAPVPQMGYLATCLDTEGNVFGLWEENPGAQ